MLRLYTARENIDKERFIYENVTGETLVLVPNQYTLVAEEQALKYLDSSCLFNVEILSMNRLGLRVLTEQGLESTRMLDKYGRFMMLGKIIKAHRDQLDIYAGQVGKTAFTAMVNDFISDFKQQDCSMEEIKDMLSGDTDDLLRAKLTELEGIVEEYERSIAGKYTDSEDYIAMYVDAIKESQLILGKDVWIYAYDSITPKFMSAMFELAKRADSVNFIVNRTDFGLDEEMLRNIYRIAAEQDVEIVEQAIGEEYALEKSETIAKIEQGLWASDLDEEVRKANESFGPDDLTIVRAANPYYEAESAAVYVWHLVRDLGFRLREIQLIANDEGVMQPIIRRTFEEYGLPIFLDGARNITDAAAVSFIVNMLWFMKYSDGTPYLLAMLKTGFAGIAYEDVEDIENYARRYKIKGSMWNRRFKYGEEAYGEEQFARLEELREQLTKPLKGLDDIGKSGTVAEFVEAFRRYLEDEWQLGEKVEEAAQMQVDMGLVEEAQRDIQSYGKALELLGQMVEIMGDEPFEIAEFTDIYLSGLADVEVGVIPPTVDGLSLGTMIRTRPRTVRAVVILGANEGTLPLQPKSEGLFSIDEKKYFKEQGFALGSLDDIKMNEENAAMYRMMSKASDKLYVSWSMTDADGGEAEPSTLIDALMDLFPRIEKDGLIKKDIISAGWSDMIVNSPRETMRHLINHLKDKKTEREMDALTQALIAWFENNDSDKLRAMLLAAKDENDPEPIGADMAGKLYSRSDGSMVLSASSIDNYFRCPFKYFVDRGLRPEEEREFSSDPRSIGDVYHECLMIIARKIIADRDFGKKLNECSDEELEQIISAELDRIAEGYNGGLFVSTANEEYRMSRIKEICAAAARAMAEQLANDSVTDAKLEEGFGRGRTFKPLEFDVDGTKVYVEGKIDRADMMDERVRIIDYKTGGDKLDLWKMRHGYKMQLMIYMMSALGDYEPAGLFYFNIKDGIASYNNKDEKKLDKNGNSLEDKKPADEFKLKGAYLDEEGVLESMPESALGSKTKMSREEFEETRADVGKCIEEIAEGIVGGKISIRPFKENNKLVCNFCQYKAICKRDRDYVLNKGREIPAKPK